MPDEKRSVEIEVSAQISDLTSHFEQAAQTVDRAADKIVMSGKKVDTSATAQAASVGKMHAAWNKLGSAWTTNSRALTVTTNTLMKNADLVSQISTAWMVAGGVLVGSTVLSIKKMVEFDQTMSKVASTGQDARNNLEDLRVKAIQAGAATVFSANDAAQGIVNLEKAGQHASDILSGGLYASLNLATAGELDVASAAEDMASTMTQFGVKGNQAAHVADLLAAAAGKAQGGVADIAAGMKYVGPVAAGMNISLEETVGTLAAFASQGILGEQAGTGLRGVLSSLTSPSKQADAELHRLHITLYDGQGKFLGLANMADQLSKAYGGMDAASRDASLGVIFGNQQVTAARVLLAQGAKGIQEWTKAANEQGYASTAAGKMMDNLGGDVEQLSGSFETALISNGEGFNRFLRDVVGGTTFMVNSYNRLPDAVKTGSVIITTALGAIALGGGGLMKAVSVGKRLSDTLQSVGYSAKVAGRLVKGIGIASAGITVALAAGLAIWGYYEQKASESADRVQDLASTFDVVNGNARSTNSTLDKMLANVRDFKAGIEFFQNKNLSDIFAGAGVSSAEAVKAIMGTDEAYAKFVSDASDAARKARLSHHEWYDWISDPSAINASNIQAQGVKDSLGQLRGEYTRSQDVAKELAKDTNALGSGYDNLSDAQSKANQGITPLDNNTQALAQDIQDATSIINAAIAAWYKWRDAQSGIIGSESSFEAAIDSATTALDKKTIAQLKGKDVNDQDNEATRKAADALRAIGDRARDYGATLMQNNSSQEQATATSEVAAAAIMKQAKTWGLGKEAAIEFAHKVTGVPTARITELTVSGTRKAAEQIYEFESKIDGIPDEKKVAISAAIRTGSFAGVKKAIKDLPLDQQLEILTTLKDSGVKGAKKALKDVETQAAKELGITIDGKDAKKTAKDIKEALAKITDKTVTVTINETEVKVHKAGGGAVGAIRGIGTSTSDSIDAKLSNGEHVVPADEVQMVGGQDGMYRLRAAIRMGQIGFASGGAVGSYDGHTLSYWLDQLKTPLELTQLQIQIRDLNKSLAEKVKKGKNKGHYKLTGLDRTEAQQQLAESKASLALARRAAQIDAGFKGGLTDAATASDNADTRSGLAEDLATSIKRGDITSSVTGGSGLSVIDQLRSWSQNDSLSSSVRSTLANTANAVETRLITLYGSLDLAKQKVQDLQSIYDTVKNGLNKFDLSLESTYTTHTDQYGNMWSTENKANAASITAQAQAQADNVRVFAAKLSALQKAGASAAVLNYIQGLGPEVGIGVADSFLTDSGSLMAFNQAYTDLETYSSQAAQYVTEASYDGGLQAAKGFQKGIEDELAGIGASLAQSLVGALTSSGTTLPGRASGGAVYANQAYRVLEKGDPEVFIPGQNGRILNLQQAQQAMSSGPASNGGAAAFDKLVSALDKVGPSFSAGQILIQPRDSHEWQVLEEFVGMASRATTAKYGSRG